MAISHLFAPAWERRVRALEAEQRELIVELEGALKKLSAWAANDYRRRVREVRERLSDGGGERTGVSDGHESGASLPSAGPPPRRSRAEIAAAARAQMKRPPLSIPIPQPTEEADEPPDAARQVSG